MSFVPSTISDPHEGGYLGLMSFQRLDAFCDAHTCELSKGQVFALVGKRPKAARLAQDAVNYAHNRRAHMRCKSQRDRLGSKIYAHIMEQILQDLPPDLQVYVVGVLPRSEEVA